MPRSPCPLAGALDLLGDKWSLLIARDLMTGKRRYGQFQASPEGIPTNILASRLRQLEAHGLIARRAYLMRPPRYEYVLTRKGADLLPVLQALARWGKRHIPGAWTPPASFLQATPADVLAAAR